MAQEVCFCGNTEPCYGGPCHFVDPEVFAALRDWLNAANAVRSTCRNLREFDALIAGQRARLDAM